RLKSDHVASMVGGHKLQLSRYHLLIWMMCWAIAALIAVRACQTYNQIAGTPKTPLHITAIAVGVIAGPMIGPFANSGSIDGPIWVSLLSLILLLVLCAALIPFLVIRGRVSRVVQILVWFGYFTACLAWYSFAILSLGYFLS
ncbi:MAG: hypothetical protein KDA78_15985, partial [Planctomycetaceae bacterium]|nr:hypothetical protein [Planctomycetaceae bacterium]